MKSSGYYRISKEFQKISNGKTRDYLRLTIKNSKTSLSKLSQSQPATMKSIESLLGFYTEFFRSCYEICTDEKLDRQVDPFIRDETSFEMDIIFDGRELDGSDRDSWIKSTKKAVFVTNLNRNFEQKIYYSDPMRLLPFKNKSGDPDFENCAGFANLAGLETESKIRILNFHNELMDQVFTKPRKGKKAKTPKALTTNSLGLQDKSLGRLIQILNS
jgi:hypothetical protein